MASAPQPAPLTGEQKALTTIQLLTEASEQVLSVFGHASIAGAVGQYASLAPVFLGLFESIRGAINHHKTASAS